VTTPNTGNFRGIFTSRFVERFPFLVECAYWGMIYWVYQLGRAFAAVWIVEGTVHAAREHALQVILWRKSCIFSESFRFRGSSCHTRC
jgi:hypothetical protein